MGSIIGATRSTKSGRSARLSAATAKAEAKGAKQRSQRDQADSQRRAYGVRYASNEAPPGLRAMARGKRQEANQGRQLVKAINRERRSLLRRGSRRGGTG
jgi:hypothetical protein